jgi:hypothetical protein
MAVSLICTCGARLQLEQVQPEQEIVCPECQDKLKVPATSQASRRTSTLALVSVVLALVGAFTLVGTVAAFVIGAIALLRILGAREHLAGIGFACLGMGLGVIFTAVTIYAVMSGGVDSLTGRIRAHMLARQVDTTGPKTVDRPDQGFTITRPSDEWGQAKDKRFDDPAIESFTRDVDLLLVQTSRYAFVDVTRRACRRNDVDLCRQDVLDSLSPDQAKGVKARPLPFDPVEEEPARQVHVITRDVRQISAPVNEKGEVVENIQGREMVVDMQFGKQRWRFLVRMYLKQPGALYVLRGYARTEVFEQVKPELIQALDSFQVRSTP